MSDGDLIVLHQPDADLPHRLGRNVNHDPRNRNYAVVPPKAPPTVSFRHRRYGTMVWQNNKGECVIGATAHCFNTAPVRSLFAARKMSCFTTAWLEPRYREVTAADPYPGQYPPDDTGTDAVSSMKVAQKHGEIPGYEWAFGAMNGLATLQQSSWMQGTDWTESMFYPERDGRVHVTGAAVGGHETLVVGYEIRSQLAVGQNRVWCLNDWGYDAQGPHPWGYSFSASNLVGNYFYLTVDDWVGLIDGRKGDLTRPKLAA